MLITWLLCAWSLDRDTETGAQHSYHWIVLCIYITFSDTPQTTEKLNFVYREPRDNVTPSILNYVVTDKTRWSETNLTRTRPVSFEFSAKLNRCFDCVPTVSRQSNETINVQLMPLPPTSSLPYRFSGGEFLCTQNELAVVVRQRKQQYDTNKHFSGRCRWAAVNARWFRWKWQVVSAVAKYI